MRMPTGFVEGRRRVAGHLADDPVGDEVVALLTGGGDARIVLDPATRTNRYHSTPYPRDVLAYASSTANDISAAAFAHVSAIVAQGLPPYREHLAQLRDRLRAAYGLDPAHRVVFAASGTDLEFVALTAVLGRAAGGVHNVLLGANEVGSGCIHSAHGNYFAGETARGIPCATGAPVPGFEAVTLLDIPVRDEFGTARTSAEIAAVMDATIAEAAAQGRHALVHVVHGSKTGLILPELADLESLIARWGGQATFVIDACQARLGEGAAREYLDAGCILFITGSKFMGGPPFSGMAVVPAAIAAQAMPLPRGMASIFRRAEFPADWPGADRLADEENPGLALRLEAAVFELERYLAIPAEQRDAIAGSFHDAVMRELAQPLGLTAILPYRPGEAARGRAHPTAMRTLVTLALTALPGLTTLADAEDLHRRLVARGIRLGQPVKCQVAADGGWAPTLRVGLSMPQVSALAALPAGEAEERLATDMRQIADALVELTQPA